MSWRDGETTTESFLDALCIFRNLVYVFFVLSVVLFLVSVVSFFVVEPGTATAAIVILNLIALGVFVLVSGVVLYLCRDEAASR